MCFSEFLGLSCPLTSSTHHCPEQRSRNHNLVKFSNLSVTCIELLNFILQGFVWNQNGEMLDQSTKEKIEHLERMTEGLKKAYNADKEMLNSKLMRMTSYQRETLQRHESLLTAYK